MIDNISNTLHKIKPYMAHFQQILIQVQHLDKLFMSHTVMQHCLILRLCECNGRRWPEMALLSIYLFQCRFPPWFLLSQSNLALGSDHYTVPYSPSIKASFYLLGWTEIPPEPEREESNFWGAIWTWKRGFIWSWGTGHHLMWVILSQTFSFVPSHASCATFYFHWPVCSLMVSTWV